MARFRSRPYATALAGVVDDHHPDRLEGVAVELERLAAAVDASPELVRAMVAPTVPQEKKTALLEGILERAGIGEPTRRFVHVLQQHYRLEELPAVAAAFRGLVDERAGRVRATVETAGPVDEESRREIVGALSRAVGADVLAEFEVEPELLAGFRARVGSKLFDGSLAAELAGLARSTAAEIEG